MWKNLSRAVEQCGSSLFVYISFDEYTECVKPQLCLTQVSGSSYNPDCNA